MKKFPLVMLSVVLIVFLEACGGNNVENDVTSMSPEDTIIAFVTSFYTTNKDNRYTTLFATMQEEDDEENLNAAIDTYFQEFASITDSSLLEKMQDNRIPVKYDSLFENDPVTVDSVELTYDENTGHHNFTVSAHNESGDLSYSGQIGIDETGLVDYFWERNSY